LTPPGFSHDCVFSQDHKAVVDVAPDWESYAFEKLDINGDGKEFFEAALAWDLTIDGKKWADGKAVSSSFIVLFHLTDVPHTVQVRSRTVEHDLRYECDSAV
jgi:hypothetical protein